MPCCAEVNDTGSIGLVSIASPVSTSRHAGFCIPIRRSASSRQDLRQEPYAICDLQIYVAPSGEAHWNQRSAGSERHIITCAKARLKTPTAPGHPANAVAA